MQRKVQLLMTAAVAVSLILPSCKKSSTTDDNNNNGGGGGSPAVAKYKKKVYVEDFTGTWCGYCPDMLVELDRKSRTTPDLVFIEVHDAAGRTDPYHTSYGDALGSAFNITGFPTALINRNPSLQADPSNVSSFISSNLSAEKVHTGIKIESSFTDVNRIKVTTYTGFSNNYTEPLRAICLLVEDSLFTNQTNYNSALGGSTLPNYLHRNVLRQADSGVYGTTIGETKRDSIVATTYYFNTTGYDRDHLRIVALVTSGANNKVYNCQYAKAGTTKDFDY